MIREHTRLLCLYALRAHATTEQQNIYVRLARRGDIGAITKLNLKTLPENYTHQFYENHLANWPQLALVAEHTIDDPTGESKVVGYVLGSMEKTAPSSRSSIAGGSAGGGGTITSMGHVTSLAVLPEWRRGGIARELMANLHDQVEGGV
ncbi:unnamed protein product [Choristocarpus tenellus]